MIRIIAVIILTAKMPCLSINAGELRRVINRVLLTCLSLVVGLGAW